MKKLEQPRGLTIDFSPSAKQYVVWQALQGNRCDHCGGTLEMKADGVDKNGHTIWIPTCSQCGNTDIPEFILMGGSAGGGKATSLDSSICTPYGFKKLRDIKIGEIITNPMTGGVQRVIYLHPIEKRQYYRITFIDKTYVDCSAEHLWQLHVAHSSAGKKQSNCVETRDYWRVWTAEMIYDWLHPANGQKNNNLIIPLSSPVQFTVGGRFNYDIKIHPYMLGCLIGNGCMSTMTDTKNIVSITTMDIEMIERLESLGYKSHRRQTKKNNKASTYYYWDLDMAKELRSLGLAGTLSYEKHIPEKYKYTTIENRKLLMQGLIDTDGYVDPRGHISYSTTSKRLAEDVAWVARSLGGKATITEKTPYYTNKNGEKVAGRIAYNVWIMTKFDTEIVFVPRKKQYARDEFNGGVSELGKRIVSCESIGEVEGRCITVDSPHGLFVTDNFTVTHNSWLGCCWVITSCIQYPGIRMVLARKELKNLLATTWSTMLNILTAWKLEQDVHYHINNQRLVLTFWNGSTIAGMELSPSPSDSRYDRLGSLEITGAFIDEVAEVQERAVEVLQSRIRYMVAESFIVGKLLASCNPTSNWIRSTFVQDDDGNPVKLANGLRYLPFSLFDNPNENFRMIYYNRLSKIRDKATRDRLLWGSWDFQDDNKMAVYYNFDGEKTIIQGLFEKKYDKMKPLIISHDFNVNPYESALMIQINWEQKEVYVLREIIGKPNDNLNNTPAFGRFVADEVKMLGHVGGVNITGDPAGMARSTQTEAGTNNFTIIEKCFLAKNIHTTVQVFNTQPAQIRRIEFINELLNNLYGWKIFIDLRCRRLTEDLSCQMKNPDGTKEKKKVLMEDGTRAEKYGHMSDCFDYALCYYLSNDFNRFVNGDAEIITTSDSDDMYDSFSY